MRELEEDENENSRKHSAGVKRVFLQITDEVGKEKGV